MPDTLLQCTLETPSEHKALDILILKNTVLDLGGSSSGGTLWRDFTGRDSSLLGYFGISSKTLFFDTRGKHWKTHFVGHSWRTAELGWAELG